MTPPLRTPPSRTTQPRHFGALLWTAFLAAATVPALFSWRSGAEARRHETRHAELSQLLRAGVEGRRKTLPDPVVAEPVTGALPDGGEARPVRQLSEFNSALVFSASELELFAQKSTSEGEFERSLQPPEALTAKANRDGVEVEWAAPADFAEVRARLRSQPLLRLGFRVYRWRGDGEPKLLTTFEGNRSAYQDRDLPLWQERFSYCVATVIEGTIGDLPTLIESKRSSVITVETVENFSLEVVDAEADALRVSLHAYVDGSTIDRVIKVAVGDAIAPEPAADLPAPLASRLDTGLTLTTLRWIEGTTDDVRTRPEFLPDGRRKLDPVTGLPTFRTETLTVPTRTLEAECRDRSGGTRTFTSVAPN